MKYTILGGGLAGLGFHLTEKNSEIYELSSKIGGHAKSSEFHGYFFDEGAHINHSKNSKWLDFINKKNINNRKSTVKNYLKNKLFGYPIQSNLGHLNKLDKVKYLNSFIKAQLNNTNKDPKNYKDWCYSSYGKELTEDYYNIFTEKYWRTPMDELSTDWLKGRLIKSDFEDILKGAFSIKSEDKSVFNYFKYPKNGGFQYFFDKAYDYSKIHLNHRATSLDLVSKEIIFNNNYTKNFSTIINSIPIPELIKITKNLPNVIKQAADNLKYTSLIQLNVIIKRESISISDLTWFYVYDEDMDISRVSIIDNLTSNRNKDTIAFQVEIFRRCDENFDINKIAEKGLIDLCRILKISSNNIINHEVQFIKYAYVISDNNRFDSVKLIEKFYESNNVYGIGLFGRWNYVWSDAAFLSGVEMAKKLEN
jgi:protoporphyrinogen oxidase